MKRVLLYGGTLTLARGIPVLAVFAASWILPASEFGALAIYVTGVTTATLLADSGTDTASTWYASRGTGEQLTARLGALVTLRLLMTIVLTVALLSTQSHLWAPSPQWAIAGVSLALVANGIAGVNSARRIEYRVQGSGERSRLILEKCVAGVLFICAVPLAGASVEWLMLAYSGSLMIGGLAAMRWARLPRTSPPEVKSLIVASTPFILSALATALIWRLPVSGLGMLGEVADAGYFALMSYPVQMLGSFAALGSSLLLIKDVKHEKLAERPLLAYTLTAIALAFVLAAVVASLDAVAPGMVFAHGAAVIGLALAFVTPPLWLNPVVTARMRMSDAVWLPTIAHWAGALVAVALLAILAPTLGGLGAATSVVLAEYAILLVLATLSPLAQRRREARG